MSTSPLSHAREWGEVYGFPVVVYEWDYRPYICELSLWLELPTRHTETMHVHALVWKDGVTPLKVLQG